MRRQAAAGTAVATAVMAAVLAGPAPRALAAPAPTPAPPVCVTSQLQPAPRIGQKLKGTVPVVFIHGISGSAAMWDTTSGTSMAGQAALIKDVTVWTFSYAHQSLDWVTEPAIGPAFAAAIACLAKASGHKVIVVAHSMGGLATQYAIGYPHSPAAGDVADLITIGTPYQGSLLLSVMRAVVSGSEAGSLASGDPGYAVLAEALLSACAGIATHTNSNLCSLVSVLRSPVGTALEWHSPQIQQLPPWPPGLPVLDTAGDIQLQITVGARTITGDFGDVPVSLGSATAHDTVGTAHVRHCSPLSLLGAVHLDPGPCYHTHLPNDSDIIDVVLTAIRADLQAETSAQSSPASFPIRYPEDMTLACVHQYGPGAQAQRVDNVQPQSYGVQCFRGGSILGGLDLDAWCPVEAVLHHFSSPTGWHSGNPNRYSSATSTIKPWETWRCYQT